MFYHPGLFYISATQSMQGMRPRRLQRHAATIAPLWTIVSQYLTASSDRLPLMTAMLGHALLWVTALNVQNRTPRRHCANLWPAGEQSQQVYAMRIAGFRLLLSAVWKRSFPHELRQSERLPALIGVKGEHRVQIQIRYRRCATMTIV
jgi:hypothetical protein